MTHQLPESDSLSTTKLIEQLSQLPTFSIGRSRGNAILLANLKVSGQHACLVRCSDHTFLPEDLNSKNGSFVNDIRVTRKLIGLSDRLRFADTECTA